MHYFGTLVDRREEGAFLLLCVISANDEDKKVLHLDRNDYYGGESASLDLQQFYKKFKNSDAPAELGRPKDYYIDLIPKYIMANGAERTKLSYCLLYV